MNYQKCRYWDCGWCYGDGKQERHRKCIGSDRCNDYRIDTQSGSYKPYSGVSRIDVIGQNGGTGEHYMGDATDKYCEVCNTRLVFEGDSFYCPEGIKKPGVDATSAKEDVVNEPNHYKLFGTVEVIDIIKELLTEEEFTGYLKGNCLKYRLRAGKKDNVEQDIAKALRYEEWLK